MNNNQSINRPIFNAKALAGATLVYNMSPSVGGGYLGAIKYLRTLGLPTHCAIVFDTFSPNPQPLPQMSIKNHKFLGKYQRPDPKRTFRVYTGTETQTGATVKFTIPNGSPVPIPPEEFRKWRKMPSGRIDFRANG